MEEELKKQNSKAQEGTAVEDFDESVEEKEFKIQDTQEPTAEDFGIVDADKHPELIPPKWNGPGSSTPLVELTADYLKSTTRISGWLTFFLTIVSFGGLVNAILPFVRFSLADAGYIYKLAIVDPLLGLMLLSVAGYTVYAFNERKPDAVFMAKIYIGAVFLSTLLELMLAEAGLLQVKSELGKGGIILSLIYQSIWFAYLCWSEQVMTVIPVNYRKLTKFNYWAAALLFGLPTLLLSWTIIEARVEDNAHQKEIAANMQKITLQDDERTDGIIVFKIPSGFRCEKEVEQNTTAFTLTGRGGDNSIMVVSEYVSHYPVSFFDDYWDAVNSSAKYYDNNVVKNCSFKVNDYNGHCRVVKYNSSLFKKYCRMYMLVDTRKDRMSVVIGFDDGDDYDFKKVLKSIKFL